MEQLTQEEHYIAPGKAAEILGVTVQRITALCRKGILLFKPIGKYHFPHIASVNAYKDNPNRLKYAPRYGKTVPLYLRKNRRKEDG